MNLRQTPSQTVGPFFASGLTAQQYGYPFSQVVAGNLKAAGAKVVIEGQVFDGANQPIVDALVELWQPGQGFLRQGTGATPESGFRFETVKPLAGEGGAPHIVVVIMMRGLLSHVFTRVYFADEEQANAKDPVLAQVPVERRATLIAMPSQSGVYRFDVHMQGNRETVFFDI